MAVLSPKQSTEPESGGLFNPQVIRPDPAEAEPKVNTDPKPAEPSKPIPSLPPDQPSLPPRRENVPPRPGLPAEEPLAPTPGPPSSPPPEPGAPPSWA
jgi:hypothetical protein